MKGCTIANNRVRAPLYNDAGFEVTTATLAIESSILRNNAEMEIWAWYPPRITVGNSLIKSSWWPDAGNIDADPLFLAPENGNFRLQPSSPCIDSGTDTDLLTDIDGNPRPVDVVGAGVDGPGAYDMGAYEFQLKGGDLDKNGFVNATDLFLFQNDWQRVSGP